MRRLLILIAASALAVSPLYSGELDAKLSKMAKKFAEASSARPGAAVPATITIFPFQTDENLAKKRVNFAASEVFTSQIFKSGKFTVVERTNLEKVLQEQKLGLSGAIETEKAVSVGKLLGAQLLTMGSINKLGGSYQISVRLVDAETSEVVASEYAEVTVKVFNEEARHYLPYVPEKQAIGLYGLYGIDWADVKLNGLLQAYASPVYSDSYHTVNYRDALVSASQRVDVNNPFGFGVKYLLFDWLLADVGLTTDVSSNKVRFFNSDVWIDGALLGDKQQYADLAYSYRTIQAGLSGVYKVSGRARAFFGAGVAKYYINYGVTGKLSSSSVAPHPITLERHLIFDGRTVTPQVDGPGGATYSLDDTAIIPYGKIGFEWKPQERLGLAAFCNMPFSSYEQKFQMRTSVHDEQSSLGETRSDLIKIMSKASPQLSAALTLYF